MIFYRKGVRRVVKGKEERYDLEEKIAASVFPGHQGGPHNHTVTALAVALAQAKTPEFKNYQEQVLRNAKALADRLGNGSGGLGYDLVSGGTDNHLILIDLRDRGIDGARLERVLDHVSLTSNKNTVPGDRSALKPGGLRIGSPAMTTRGMQAVDFERIAEIIDRSVGITQRLDKEAREASEERKRKNPGSVGAFLEFLEGLRMKKSRNLDRRMRSGREHFLCRGNNEWVRRIVAGAGIGAGSQNWKRCMKS